MDNIGPNFASLFRDDRYDLLHIIASFAGMQAYLLPQAWSIFIEIIASIAMPGIAFVALHRPRWMPLMLIIATAISFTVERSPYEICLYFMDFVVGAALAMHRLPAIALAWLVPVCLAVLSTTLLFPLSYKSPTAHIIETFFSALTISVLISTPIPWLRTWFMKFVGDISYSIYPAAFCRFLRNRKGIRGDSSQSEHRRDDLPARVRHLRCDNPACMAVLCLYRTAGGAPWQSSLEPTHRKAGSEQVNCNDFLVALAPPDRCAYFHGRVRAVFHTRATTVPAVAPRGEGAQTPWHDATTISHRAGYWNGTYGFMSDGQPHKAAHLKAILAETSGLTSEQLSRRQPFG